MRISDWSSDVGSSDLSFEQVMTDNQVTVNGLLGVGLELGNQKLRWTNLYIRDTLKRASLSTGQNDGALLGGDYLNQSSAWYERQLIDTQIDRKSTRLNSSH